MSAARQPVAAGVPNTGHHCTSCGARKDVRRYRASHRSGAVGYIYLDRCKDAEGALWRTRWRLLPDEPSPLSKESQRWQL